MTDKLKNYFPLIREREELLAEIKGNPRLREIYEEWNTKNREEFLDFCTGVRGMKILEATSVSISVKSFRPSLDAVIS